MTGSRAAQRYAKATLSMAREKEAGEAVKADMLLISQTLEASKELRGVLESPVIKASLKKNIFQEVFKKINKITENLFMILLENNRIELLKLVAEEYLKRFDESILVQDAVVTTVIPLTEGLEDKIQQKIKQLTGREAKIKNVIDESIIGGFLLRVGDLQYDASISNNLETLKKEFKDRTYSSKI